MPDLHELKRPYDFVIFDGRNVGYIYHNAMSNLRNSSGESTGMYHGFLSLLLRLKLRFIQAKFVIAWEGGDLVRKEAISGYKGQRVERDVTIEAQYKTLKQLLCMMGVQQLYATGYEADDVAATFVKQCVDRQQRVLLVTEDRDWNQILREGVSFWRKNRELTYASIAKAEGFPPERFALYVLMKGKSSNNVHGVKGFPDKLAKLLVNKCKNTKDLFKEIAKEQFEAKWIKWLGKLSSNRKLLLAKYAAILLNTSACLEEVQLCRKNMKQLKKRLHNLQLSKVINLLSQIRRKVKATKK